MRNKPLHGIALLTLAVFFFTGMNVAAKLASSIHHPVEILFYRGLVPLLILIGYLLVSRKTHLIKTVQPHLQLARAVAGTFAMLLVFWAYSLMPMADTATLLFVQPLIVVLLAGLVLGERIGLIRIAAVFVGFSGVLLITQPSGSSISFWGVAVALAAALATAINDILLRVVGKKDSAVTTTFWLLVVSTLATGLFMPWIGKPVTPYYLIVLLSCGLLGGMAQMCKVESHRHAEASLLTPFNYTAIVWASLAGWLLWRDLPTIWVLTGAAVIIGSNLFLAAIKKKTGI